MANVGWVGLGRLGAPCAAALAYHGKHDVYGHDVRGDDATGYDWAGLPPVKLLPSVAATVAATDDLVFVAVQTPHARRYGGEVPTPSEPRDFEYGYLVAAVTAVCDAAQRLRKAVTLVIVSTVLPGTFNRYLRPLLNGWVIPVYHPFFIAMGTIVDDFLAPEQVLLGVDDPDHALPVIGLYGSLHDAHVTTVTIASAELAKVAYNTFISCKIVFANTLMQLSDATGADVDEVTRVLARADERITSARYLTAGVGDGGACHPRDNVALSALARRVGAVDLMGFINQAREEQAAWLTRIVSDWAELTRLPIVILGRAYKPEVPLVDGSSALLLVHLLREQGHSVGVVDPVVDPTEESTLRHCVAAPRVFCVATAHAVFADLPYPVGAVVIDPFGYVPTRPGVTLVRPGRH